MRGQTKLKLTIKPDITIVIIHKFKTNKYIHQKIIINTQTHISLKLGREENALSLNNQLVIDRLLQRIVISIHLTGYYIP